jgi:hypothetical protein
MPITTTPSGGPQGEFSTCTPIYATTISSNTSAITLSNIPTTFTDLVLVISVISTSNVGNYIHLQYNGDTGSNYSTTILSGTGSGAVSQRFSNRTNFNIDYYATPNTTVGTRIVQIQNYSNTTTFKTGLLRADRAAGTDNAGGTDATVGLWRSTAPITSITITHDTAQFASGSTITLYGIKAAATQFIPTKAAGGDIVASDGTYAYHAFLTSGTFNPAQSLSCDYLVVAGGGGGGTRGAGGAGGYRSATAVSISTPISVTVGGGGSIDTNGSDSIFSITSTGGGKGATSTNAGNGGSGGGGYNDGATNFTAGTGNTPSTSPSQGNNGGAGGGATRYTGGGGGGAGEPGSPGQSGDVPRAGGAGGIGSNAHSSWLSVVGLGGSGYLAGGGGGGGDTGGAGGSGGGGKGADAATNTAVAGTANTGGGGGAGRSGDGVAKAGGSGIVIVRYTL